MRRSIYIYILSENCTSVSAFEFRVNSSNHKMLKEVELDCTFYIQGKITFVAESMRHSTYPCKLILPVGIKRYL